MRASNYTKMNEMLSTTGGGTKSRKAGNFNHYLKKLGHSKNSIASCETAVGMFLKWMEKQSIEPENGSYADVLAYIKHCQKNGTSQRTIQNYVNMIRHYYDHLGEQKRIEVNPTTGIKIQGVKRKLLYHIFKPEELHAIYNSYQDESLKGKRNKVMLGLLVYQGVKTEELTKLEIKDVKMKEGKIEIPGGLRSESRILSLEPHQVLEFYDYINTTRKEILSRSKQHPDSHPDSHRDDLLFLSIEGGHSMSSCITRLMFWLRRKNKSVVNAKQLRASVITKWLKMYNLRKVQYMAGHRYISATESYKQNEMEGLAEEVNKFHPLG
jgi:integrase/recombinase XerD